MQILSIISSILSKIIAILSNTWGLVLSLSSSLLLYTLPVHTFIIVITILVAADLLLGVWINRRNILSHRLRDTLIKLVFYIFTLVFSFCIENSIKVLLLTPMLFSVMAIIELISVCANMSIVLPNVKFFKLIRIMLKSEIAKKSGLDEKIVDDIIEDKKDE